jgi:hypothetical protein
MTAIRASRSRRTYPGLCLLAFLVLLSKPGAAAEANKVWRDLAFGMTFDETVTALGELVSRYPTEAEREAERQRASQPIDVEEANDSAAECSRREDAAGRPLPQDVADAVKALNEAIKKRTWLSDGWIDDDGRPRKLRLIGELRKIEPSGAITILLGNGRSATTQMHSLDVKSRHFVDGVRAAAKKTDAFRQALADREFKPDDSARITSPHQFSLKTVNVEGLAFQPELRFTPNLSSIILKTDAAKAAPDMFERLTEMLRKTYGEDDDAIKSADGRRRIWRGEDATVVLAHTVRQSNVPVYSRAAGADYGFTALQTVTRNVLSIEYISPGLGHSGDRLLKGAAISAGDGLRSICGRHVLQLTKNGELLLHHDGKQSPSWAPQNDGKPAATLTLREDGDLALLDADGRVVWNSGTKGLGGEFVCMQDDGNLVIYTSDMRPVWATNTVRN